MVILGANRLLGVIEAGSLRVTATRTIRHPKHNPSNLNNDIALFQLPSTVSFTSEYCHILMNIK